MHKYIAFTRTCHAVLARSRCDSTIEGKLSQTARHTSEITSRVTDPLHDAGALQIDRELNLSPRGPGGSVQGDEPALMGLSWN